MKLGAILEETHSFVQPKLPLFRLVSPSSRSPPSYLTESVFRSSYSFPSANPEILEKSTVQGKESTKPPDKIPENLLIGDLWCSILETL